MKHLQLLCFEGFCLDCHNLVNTSLMSAALKLCFKENVNHFKCETCTYYSSAEAKCVCIVVKACEFSGFIRLTANVGLSENPLKRSSPSTL